MAGRCVIRGSRVHLRRTLDHFDAFNSDAFPFNDLNIWFEIVKTYQMMTIAFKSKYGIVHSTLCDDDEDHSTLIERSHQRNRLFWGSLLMNTKTAHLVLLAELCNIDLWTDLRLPLFIHWRFFSLFFFFFFISSFVSFWFRSVKLACAISLFEDDALWIFSLRGFSWRHFKRKFRRRHGHWVCQSGLVWFRISLNLPQNDTIFGFVSRKTAQNSIKSIDSVFEVQRQFHLVASVWCPVV